MKWEYKIVHIDARRWTATGLPNDVGQQFDRWGDEGWELVKVEPIQRGGWFLFFVGTFSLTVGFVAFFKRPKGGTS